MTISGKNRGVGADDPVPEPIQDAAGASAPRARRPHISSGERVQAVLTERSDGTCVSFRQGLKTEWASVAEAWGALEDAGGHLVWHETTPGVWVARADQDDTTSWRQEPLARATEGGRGTTTDTYTTARVLKGFTLEPQPEAPARGGALPRRNRVTRRRRAA